MIRVGGVKLKSISVELALKSLDHNSAVPDVLCVLFRILVTVFTD